MEKLNYLSRILPKTIFNGSDLAFHGMRRRLAVDQFFGVTHVFSTSTVVNDIDDLFAFIRKDMVES